MFYGIDKDDHGNHTYICHRIFGSSRLIRSNKLDIRTSHFLYLEVSRYPVDDCTNAVQLAKDAANLDFPEKLWETLTIIKDDKCYKMSQSGVFSTFETAVFNAIKEDTSVIITTPQTDDE